MNCPGLPKFDYDERLEALLQLALFRDTMRTAVGVSGQYLGTLPPGDFKDQHLARHQQLVSINEELLANLEATRQFIDGGQIFRKADLPVSTS